MLYDGSESAKYFPRIFQSVPYLSAFFVIILQNILLHKCFTNSMRIVKTLRRQVCLYELMLSLSNKNRIVVFYTEHLAYLLDCLVCYEIMTRRT